MTYDLINCVADENWILRNKNPPIEVPNISLSELLFQKLSSNTPSLDIFIDGVTGRKWTSPEIKAQATRIASGLIESGLTEGDIIVGYMPNNDVHAICQLAIVAAGGVYAGCAFTDTKHELHYHVEVTQAKFIFCGADRLEIASEVADEVASVEAVVVIDGQDAPKTASGKRVILLSEFTSKPAAVTQIPIKLSKSPKEAAVGILFSSGSTGKPKGVIRTHYNCVAYLIENLECTQLFGPNKGVVTCHQPLAHTTGLVSVILSAGLALPMVFNPPFTVEHYLKTVQKYKITGSYLAPTSIIAIIKSPLVKQYDISTLEYVSTGGAVLPDMAKQETTSTLKLEDFWQLYGTTEFAAPFRCFGFKKIETVGIPSENTEVKIVDRDTGLALGPNQVGEAFVRTPQNSPGYLNNPTATAEVFMDDGFYRTGDAMYYDEKGFLYIVDRYKEIIKVDTAQVAPAELESILLQHEAVEEAAIIGIPDEDHGQVPKAFIVLKSAHKKDAEKLRQELIDYLNEKVGHYKQLRGGLTYVDHFTKIGLGKIDRGALKRLAAAS